MQLGIPLLRVTPSYDREQHPFHISGPSVSLTIDLQRIMNYLTATKIQLNEQNAKELAFFCFFVCGYKRQRHQLAKLLPIDAFEAFII